MRHLVWIWTSILLSSSMTNAGQIGFRAGYALSSQYSIPNLNTSYSLTGLNLGINYSFKGSGDEFAPSDEFSENQALSFDYFTNLGFNYLSLTGKLATSLTDPSLTNTLDLTLYQLQINLFQITLYNFSLEVPLLLAMSSETKGQNQGDEKYAYGVGVYAFYKFYDNFSLGIDYEKTFFSHGKNNSSGKSGTLANKVELTNTSLLLRYFFSF